MLGEPTVFICWKAGYCLSEKASLAILPRGLRPWHDNKWNCQELGRTRLFPYKGNLQTTGKREDV